MFTGHLCERMIPGNTFYQPDCILPDMDNIHSANGNANLGDKLACVAASEATEGHNSNVGSLRSSPPSVVVETPKEAESVSTAPPSVRLSPSPAPNRPEDQNNNNQRGQSPASHSVGLTSPSPSPPAHAPLPKVGPAPRKPCLYHYYSSYLGFFTGPAR